jgi:glycosyltransferase involved in cell wall biosynthesis
MVEDLNASALWLFWPDYSHDNPFQRMLYSAFPPGWTVRSADIVAASEAVAETHCPVVFHLHWEDMIYRDAANMAAAEALVDVYLELLDAFIASGGRLVWTVHNDAPHEHRFPEVDRRLRNQLAIRAHVVQMHSQVAAACMAPPLGVATSRVLVTPLGGFAGYYPDDITKPQARQYFGIEASAPVFVTLGSVRPYKGIDVLLSAFAMVHQAKPETRLILAGRSNQQGVGRFISLRPGVLMLPRYIDDATVQYVMRAADFAVFSFHRIMVSSSVLLAETFGLPVIVPDLPTMREMVQPGHNGFLVAADDPTALARTMLGTIGLSTAERAALGRAALDDIRQRDWTEYTRALTEAAINAVPA